MSIKVMNLVWNSTIEGTYKRFALLALADRASDQGEVSALGVPNLCRKTGIKRSKMFALLKELEQGDALVQRVEQHRPNHSRRASKFWINIPLLQELQRAGNDDRDQDEEINPFTISAAQTPVHDMDGAPSTTWTGPIRAMDGLGVHDMDGAHPGHGPLSPSPSETTDPDPDEASPRSGERRKMAARIRSRLKLAKVGAKPKQVRQIEDALAHLLDAGFSEGVVEHHAQHKLGEANTCKYLLNGLTPEHVVESSSDAASLRTSGAAAPDRPCGQCDARPGEPIAARVVWKDEDKGVFDWCPRCHPKAADRS